MLAAIDRPAVVAGAVWCLALAVPAAVASALLDDGDGDPSNWILVAALVVVVAYLVGGARAGRRAPRAPFLNGAAATVSAWAAVQAVGVVVNLAQGDGVSLVRLVFNALLAASIGTVGAWFGARRAAPVR